MAGGKETPRQKMIGMMYLVLTALLALQVSSAIIYKFQFLNESIENSIKEEIARTVTNVATLKAAVQERGNKEVELKLLEQADQIRNMTKGLIDEMDGIKNKLIDDSGGREEDGSYKGAKEEDQVAILMVGSGETKSGKAYELQKKLNDYAVKMSTFTGRTFKPFALDGKDDPIFQNNPEQKNKDFAKLNFETTPMVAALAVLSELQARVVSIEALVIGDLKAKVGAADFKFDVVSYVVKPESKVVAAGTKYKAEMFIGARDSKMIPTMKYAGKDIPVVNGIGTVEFTAQGGAYDKDGNFKTKWKGEITIPKPTGGDTTLVVEEEYIVARPVIQIQSASVSALYMNCGNEINVQVPALGQAYNPAFSGQGASFLPGGQKGLVTIIPNAPKVKLVVSSSGNHIGDQEFRVRPVPKPDIIVLVGGKPVNEKSGIPAPGPRAITVVAEPDQDFKNFLPKDARYQVSEYQVTLARGKREVLTKTVRTPQADLSDFMAQARANDRINIEVKGVKRKNFRDNVEDVNVGTVVKIISLTD